MIRNLLLRKNRNFFVLAQGDTGTGKSESIGLTLCKAVDPTFDMNRIAYAKPAPFLRIINSGDLKKGNSVMWDDAGLGMPARKFMSTMNQALSEVIQIFRTDNILVVVTVPDLSMLDKHMKLLYHAQIDSQEIDYKRKHAVAKFLKIQINRNKKKVYRKHFRMRRPDGKIITLTKARFALAPKELRQEYGRWRKALTKETKARALQTVEDVESQMAINKERKLQSPKLPPCQMCGKRDYRANSSGLRCRVCGHQNPPLNRGDG